MRLKKVVKTMACCLAVSFSMCIGLLGGVGTITAYAQENGEETIGEAVYLDDAETVDSENSFEDTADTVDASSVTFSGTYDYTQAYQILDEVNKQRAANGLPALTMDKDLLEAAMFRAAETAVLFDHIRPNGKSCVTVCNKMSGENIAINWSVARVMESWMNSSGHRGNILNSTYKSIGVGVFTQGNQIYYVQSFGRGSASQGSKPSNVYKSVSVEVSNDNMRNAEIITETDSSGVTKTYLNNLDSSVKELDFLIALDTKNETVSLDPVTLPEDEITAPECDVTVKYQTHVQNVGWQNLASDGKTSGTRGQSKRLEAIKISLEGNDNLGIRYRTHIESIGWESQWKADGQMSGTSGRSLRLEAIQIELTGSDSSKYDVYYRVHAESYGWLGWAKNGECAGTAGQSKRLEAIQIAVVPKGTYPSGLLGYSYIQVGKYASNGISDGLINYSTHVEKYGDQSYVYDGSVSGTFGESKRLEAIRINLNNNLLGLSGGVRYTTHVEKYGWQQPVDNPSVWSKDGEASGTSGESKRLEAICIELYGDVAQQYDVYYRVHAEHFGWLGWAKNGAPAGTAGYSKRLEGIQIVLLPKGSAAPSTNPGKAGTSPYIAK